MFHGWLLYFRRLVFLALLKFNPFHVFLIDDDAIYMRGVHKAHN